MLKATTELSALDVLRREDIPAEDRLRIVLRPQMLGDLFAPAMACIAWHVLHIFEDVCPGDTRVRDCIDTLYAAATDDAARAAYAAATDASNAAAAADYAARAAYAAAYAARATYAAAYAAHAAYAARATYAARAAADAESAACAAADAAAARASADADDARAAELQWQIQHLVEMLESE